MKKTFSLLLVLQAVIMGFSVLTGPSAAYADVRQFNATIVTVPETLYANQSFQVVVKGELPSADYEITDSSIAILESFPEQIHVDLTIEVAEDASVSSGQNSEPVSFERLIGVLKFGEAPAPRALRGYINGEQFFDGELDVQSSDSPTDSRPFITFDRTGGFAGISLQLFVDGNGGYLFEGNPPFSVNPPFGKLDWEEFSELVNQTFAVDFSALDKRYQPSTTIYDGFNHAITIDGKRVDIEQGAELPVELDALFETLNRMMNGDIKVEERALSSVDMWEMY